MKKIFTLLFVLAGFFGYAQNDSIDVTFYLGTAHVGADANGVFIGGGTLFGGPTDNQMSDADGGGVFTFTKRIKKGESSYYTFLNGNCGWGCKEQIAGQPCAVPSNYNDRFFPGAQNDTVITTSYEVCTTDTVYTPPADPAPKVAAATPSVEADSVICLFSDAYTDVTVDTWRTGWSQADLTETSVNGDSIKKYANLNFVGVETVGANLVDASKMGYFHIDFWSSDTNNFRVKLVDFGANKAWGDGAGNAGGDDTEFELTYVKPTAGEWTSWHIPLSDFTDMNTDNIAQVIFSADPGGALVYVDNVLFTTEASVIAGPKVAAADPTAEAGDVISLFSNVYTDVTVDTWRTSWSNATLEEVQVDGNDVKKYSGLDFVGVETVADNSLDVSNHTNVNFDVWNLNATTYRIKIVDFGADNAYGGGDDTEHEIAFENPATKTWTNHKIALADFTNLTGMEHISQIIFSALPTGGSTLYIDNVYFSDPKSGSTKNVLSNEFTVYPNPATSMIQLKSAKNVVVKSIDILDLQGKVVSSNAINAASANYTIDISNLESGVYFVLVSAENGSYNQRIIVE